MPRQHPVIWITWDEAHIDTLGVFGAALIIGSALVSELRGRKTAV